MRTSRRKSRKTNLAANRSNPLRLEFPEQRMLLSVTIPSASINPLDTITYETRADGMPILNSLSSAPGNIFLDFDGDTTNSWAPFNIEGTDETFSTKEQTIIVDCWRQVVDYFSMFDINVTTIQPNVATQPTTWHVITPTYNNGGLG
jgi:hypothetical protein